MDRNKRLKLQILIPQYKEDDAVVSELLDSIAMQRYADFDEIGVIIGNDGSDVILSEETFRKYPFPVDYILFSHRGVSATRNSCLKRATADYVMFCDADDVFFTTLGLWKIMDEIKMGFDCLSSAFCEEIKFPNGERRFDIRSYDGIFVHGKVFRRQYLKDQKILFDEELSINEDSYFVALCQNLSKRQIYAKIPFYLWKWRDDSVSHKDPKYEFKAYYYMLESNDRLVKDFVRRKHVEDAWEYMIQMLVDANKVLTDPEWKLEENAAYYDKVILRLRLWLRDHGQMWSSIPDEAKIFVIKGMLGGTEDKEALDYLAELENWIESVQIK